MPYKTASPKLRGQALAEFILILPMISFLFIGIASLSGLFAAKHLLHLENYAKARAQLYGKENDTCSPSRFWPNSRLFHVQLECFEPGFLRATLHFSSYFTNQSLWTYRLQTDLRPPPRGAL